MYELFCYVNTKWVAVILYKECLDLEYLVDYKLPEGNNENSKYHN